MPTKSIPGPATGRKIANVVVVEFMGDIFHKIAEELRLIMLRCHVQDASLPRIFQLVVIVGANQIYHENLKPLADFMFYHMDLLEDNIPNFTGQMIRRNASIQPKLLESLSNACSSVRVSSEMHAYIRDLLTALRNDRRLCRGISARISRGFFAACQFAAMIHYRSEYLGSEHVEAAANWALCHHLHCRTGISNIKQSRAILADVICRLPKPF
jgi:hypothetical protein